MRKLQKQIEKVLIYLSLKMDANSTFKSRFMMTIIIMSALSGMIVGYHIFIAFLWLFVYNYALFNLVIVLLMVLFFGWILWTERS